MMFMVWFSGGIYCLELKMCVGLTSFIWLRFRNAYIQDMFPSINKIVIYFLTWPRRVHVGPENES